MAEQYDTSNDVSDSQLDSQTAKAASDQKDAEAKGAAGAAAAKAKFAKKSPAQPGSATAQGGDSKSNASAGGGLVGAIKNKIAGTPAAAPAAAPTAAALGTPGTVGGGNSAVDVNSPKGQALTADPKANLAAKGRFSDYRKVFSARGAAGKHPWGGQ